MKLLRGFYNQTDTVTPYERERNYSNLERRNDITK